MTTYKGNTATFSFYNDKGLKKVFDRSIFSNTELYPGDSWKMAHFILFGYYPKDFNDMCTFTSNCDHRKYGEYHTVIENCENRNIKWDDFDLLRETIKFVTEKNVDFPDEIHKVFMGEKYMSKYPGDNINLSYLCQADFLSELYEENKNSMLIHLSRSYKIVSWDLLGTFRSIVNYYFLKKIETEKNPMEELAKKLSASANKNKTNSSYFDDLNTMIEIDKDAFTKKMIDKIMSKFRQSIGQFVQESTKNGQKENAIKAIKSGIFKIKDISIVDGKLNCKIYNNQITFELSNDTNIRYFYNVVEMQTA